MKPAYLKTVSRKNRKFGYVPTLNILGYDLIFADLNETLMSIQSKDEPISPYKSSSEIETKNQMILKF